jgi:hypothetical protein
VTKKRAKKTKKEAQKKETAKNPKRRNQTDHERAMKTPCVREIFSALQSNWDKLTSRQAGEQLQRLEDLGCTGQGLARDLEKSETNIRKRIKEANSSDERGGWIAAMESTLAKTPDRRKEISAIEASRESKAMFQKNKKAGTVIKEKPLTKGPKDTLGAQPKEKFTTTSLISAKETAKVTDKVSEQSDQAGESASKMTLVDYSNSIRQGRIQRLIDISQSDMTRRPLTNASQLGRQGRPIPPKKD